MAHCYKFAIVRLAPDTVRDERINVGAVVFSDDDLDVRVSRRLDKVRAISAAADVDMLRDLVENMRGLDERLRAAGSDHDARFGLLSHVGPVTLSPMGTFEASDAATYEARLEAILKSMVDPEPAPPRMREKRSRLLTQVKDLFRRERVLATKDETLEAHRIVPSFELDEGLVADFVLKNGSMHVVETVDASSDTESLNKAISAIAVSALVLERARMKYGKDETKARLVYSATASLEKVAMPSLEAAHHQGAELTNWASADDRTRFIHSLSSLATPVPRKRRARVVSGQDALRFH
jgi:hypothetical protein